MVNFHIEATSKCTLECPLCDRTWFYNTFKKRLLHEINIDDVVNFVGNDKRVHLCGNNGDPIYHSNFLELCRRLKQNNSTLRITTNGSAKKIDWWKKLSTLLDENDKIEYSIDGLEDTNHVYRKNSNWKQIMEGVKSMRVSKVSMTWKFIVFKHNQHQIKEAEALSKQLGFDHFRLINSHRWNDGQELMPDSQYVNTLFDELKQSLTSVNNNFGISPKCMENNLPTNGLYIDAEGDFYPCCYMGSYRYKYKSVFSPNAKRFNIKNTKLDEILNDKEIKNFFDTTKQFTSAHECCKLNCGIKNG